MKREGRISICGVWIDNVSMREAVERIAELVKHRQPCYVVTPNVDHIVRFQHDARFRDSYEHAELVLVDGKPVVWAAYLLGRPFKEKVSGSDLFVAQCRDAAERGHRLFFMGGRPGAAQKSKENLERLFPGLQVAGICCPPMGFENDQDESRRAIECIRAARPDVLYVGIGTPKQEAWIAKHYREIGVPVTVGVGASFDFVSGLVKRAPRVFQKCAMEWFWRLAHEPRRLWRRYLVDDPEFIWLILKQKFDKSG